MEGYVNGEVREPTLLRTERVEVKYTPLSQPELHVEVERPYKVTATGQVEGTARYTLERKGTSAMNSLRVTTLGLWDAVKAAYMAYKNPVLTGGLSQRDHQEVKRLVDLYNPLVELFRRVAGKTVTALKEEKEIGLKEIPDQDLEQLLKEK